MNKCVGLLTFVSIIVLSGAARGDFVYTGPVVARTSGVTCRGTNGLVDVNNFYRSVDGLQPDDAETVFCPIIRRNAAPYGQLPSSYSGDTVVNLNILDVYLLQPVGTAISCKAYGTSQLTGSQIISSPVYSCASNPNGGCTSAPPPFSPFYTSVSLHFTDPLSGAHNTEGMVNIGYTCVLPDTAGYIIGSVAQFPTF